jgi:NADPH:quinone reductase-like Zn-dependent oxidoreductase
MPSVSRAGIEAFSANVELLDFRELRPLEADELLVDVRAADVGDWDEIGRHEAGTWGDDPQTALGVEAAGVVGSVGREGGAFEVGHLVLVHSAPFRDPGAWAQQFVPRCGRCHATRRSHVRDGGRRERGAS